MRERDKAGTTRKDIQVRMAGVMEGGRRRSVVRTWKVTRMHKRLKKILLQQFSFWRCLLACGRVGVDGVEWVVEQWNG